MRRYGLRGLQGGTTAIAPSDNTHYVTLAQGLCDLFDADVRLPYNVPSQGG